MANIFPYQMAENNSEYQVDFFLSIASFAIIEKITSSYFPNNVIKNRSL
jgi:hypothetical protein